MAIHGVTDRHTKMPVLGKIRLGVKSTNQKGKEFPTETPYFFLNKWEEVTDKKGNPVIDKKTGKPQVKLNEDIERAIEVLGGDQLLELTVYFPVDPLEPENKDLCLSSYLKWWGNGTMMCVGDNKDAYYSGMDNVPNLNHPEVDTEKVVNPIPPRKANRKCGIDICPQYAAGKCKAETNIRFIIPDVSKNALFQIDTRSWQAITEIGTQLELIRNDLKERGYSGLRNVPLKIIRQERKNKANAKFPGKNYIIQFRLAEKTLQEENQKLLDGVNSYVKHALPNSKIPQIDLDPINQSEPNYDLLPQSEHGHYQAGDEVVDVIPEGTPDLDTADQWIEDPQVFDLFTELGDILGTQVTPAKMKARAMKCKTKDELIGYLKSQIHKHETSEQAAQQ